MLDDEGDPMFAICHLVCVVRVARAITRAPKKNLCSLFPCFLCVARCRRHERPSPARDPRLPLKASNFFLDLDDRYEVYVAKAAKIPQLLGVALSL
jgi:hypothetical protein